MKLLFCYQNNNLIRKSSFFVLLQKVAVNDLGQNKMEQSIVIKRLQESSTEENLWQAIIAFQGYPFKTASGLPFQYQLKVGRDGNFNRELLIDRREHSKTLSWSSLRLAFERALVIQETVDRPKALGDIRGISYIYPLLWKFGLIQVPEEIAEKMIGNESKNEQKKNTM